MLSVNLLEILEYIKNYKINNEIQQIINENLFKIKIILLMNMIIYLVMLVFEIEKRSIGIIIINIEGIISSTNIELAILINLIIIGYVVLNKIYKKIGVTKNKQEFIKKNRIQINYKMPYNYIKREIGHKKQLIKTIVKSYQNVKIKKQDIIIIIGIIQSIIIIIRIIRYYIMLIIYPYVITVIAGSWLIIGEQEIIQEIEINKKKQ